VVEAHCYIAHVSRYGKQRKMSGTDKTIAAAGKAWSEEEESKLLEAVRECVDVGVIAKDHQRTRGAITARLQRIACQMIDKGSSLREASDAVRLEASVIENAYERRRSAKQDRVSAPGVSQCTRHAQSTYALLVDIRDLVKSMDAKLSMLCPNPMDRIEP
jgi:hypothetical protein